MDFVSEFVSGDYKKYSVVFKTISAGKYNFIKIDNNGNVLSSLIKDVRGPSLSSTRIQNWAVTNDEFLRRYGTGNYSLHNLNAKISLENIYNPNDRIRSIVNYNLNGLSRGWHHFAISFDSMKGTFTMHVDGDVVSQQTFENGKYRFSNIIDGFLFAGCSPYYYNTPLFERLGQDKYYISKNIKSKDFKIYNKALNHFDIRMHMNRFLNINDVNFNATDGGRFHVEQVERTFKHRPPGSKNTLVDVNINNSTITDEELRNVIMEKTRDEFKRIAPAHLKLKDINFKEYI